MSNKPTFHANSNPPSPLKARRTLNSSTNSYESFSDLTSTGPPLGLIESADRRSSLASFFFPNSTSTPPSSPSLENAELRRNSYWRRFSLLSIRSSDSSKLDTQLEQEHQHEQEEEDKQDWLSTGSLIGLTIGLAGAQFCWTVEMAYAVHSYCYRITLTTLLALERLIYSPWVYQLLLLRSFGSQVHSLVYSLNPSSVLYQMHPIHHIEEDNSFSSPLFWF